ncbi:hypothetical protein C3R19_13080 [Blautia producta]|nr:hypothetical protein C3R19_13080 [Blautia producta]
MNQQEMVCLMVLAAVFCLAALFLIYGGFESIKEAMQSFGAVIWKITFWPVEKYREHKEIVRIERQWQEYIELHKGELVSELMKSAHQEMAGKQYKTEELGAAVIEFFAKFAQAGISVQDIDGQEERTWQDKIMDRFMRRM